MQRRKFVRLSLAGAVLSPFAVSCGKKKKIRGGIIGASASVGHLLRDRSFSEATVTEELDVVIVGGGVSGLTAARQLARSGISRLLVLDLEKAVGGNALHGTNTISSYPWGAHYVPIPNNDLTEYLQFLTECGVVTGRNAEGLPVYNEYHLCFDPQDRLYINGKWQEGLVPQFGVPEAEQKQLGRFLQLMDEYRNRKGSDGLDAFAIPVDRSSTDRAFTDLDRVTMDAWMRQNGFTSEALHWYVNYCTRDDFGTTHQTASAWAGIHYFASRKGKGANADHSDVLTWPEGNGWLVQQLQKDLAGKLKTGALVVRVQKRDAGVEVDYLDTETKALKRIRARQCIMAIPQFVAARLLHDGERIASVQRHFRYAPWMVANLTVSGLEERSGAPASWDNVLYDSPSLGYVVATHELVQQQTSRKNITYYLPLTEGAPTEVRRTAHDRTYNEWVEIVLDDLKKVHPNIEAATEEVNVMVWGHAMVQPLPGLMHGGVRHELAKPVGDVIHFAHTDLAGVSIFEEGFYQGLNAAKNVHAKLSSHA